MGNQITRRLLRILGVVFLLICIPFSARANAGTPLMWAGMLHMVFGNAIIGLFEGLMLGWILKRSRGFCICVMIGANYFSAWVGGLFLNHYIENLLAFTLHNAWCLIWVMVGLTYLLTLVLEWPFVLICFRNEERRWRKSIAGNLLVNSASYLLLFGWYWMASGTSLYTKMKIVPAEEICFPTNGVVYYISKTNGVCSFDFSSRQTTKIFALETDKDDRLLVKASPNAPDKWDVWDVSKTNLVCSNLEVAAAEAECDKFPSGRIDGTMFNFGNAPKVGLAGKSDWNFRTGFWPIEGLRGDNNKTKDRFRFSLETPFLAWNVRNATHLPGDYVIFQLGDDQICLLELATKKIALLANGQGPVVVFPKTN